jgi:hypothetical protein
MTGLLVITGFITLIGILAIYAGTDTRDGQDWKPRYDPWPVLEWVPDDRPPYRASGGPRGGLCGIDGGTHRVVDGGAGRAGARVERDDARRGPRASGTVGEAA